MTQQQPPGDDDPIAHHLFTLVWVRAVRVTHADSERLSGSLSDSYTCTKSTPHWIR